MMREQLVTARLPQQLSRADRKKNKMKNMWMIQGDKSPLGGLERLLQKTRLLNTLQFNRSVLGLKRRLSVCLILFILFVANMKSSGRNLQLLHLSVFTHE